MVNLSIDLPEDLFSTLHKDRAEMARDILLAAAIKFYERGLLSQERAAEMSGLTRSKFIFALRDYAVTPFQYSAEEILNEVDSLIK